jgi:pyrroloquinoline quinone biosynthesis protein D
MEPRMPDEDTVLALTPVATFQPLGEQEGAVILMVDSGQLYSCNDTTVALLRAIDGARKFGAVIDLVHAEFDVDRDVLTADLREVVAELVREGILAAMPNGR